MRTNYSVVAGMLAVFVAVGAFTVLPAFSETADRSVDVATTDSLSAAIDVAPASETTTLVPTTTTQVPTTTTQVPTTTAAPTSTSTTTTAVASSTTTTTAATTTTTSTTTTTEAPTTTSAAISTTTAQASSTTTTSAVRARITSSNAVDYRTDTVLSEKQFEAVVEDEIFRLTNCARTGDFSNWCVNGDAAGWNITGAERNPPGEPLSALGRSAQLDTQSQAWSENLVAFDNIFHSDAAGVSYGENVAYNPALHGSYELTSANAVELAAVLTQQWMDSPSHRIQIMYPNYSTLGVGVEVKLSDPSPDTFVEIWGTQQFQ